MPRETTHKGLVVRFAAREADADSLIEELIIADHSPRRLTVVSSDHRIQRAASAAAHGRSIATYGTPRSFVRETSGARQRKDRNTPTAPLLEEDVEYWLKEFGLGQKSGDARGEETRKTRNSIPVGRHALWLACPTLTSSEIFPRSASRDISSDRSRCRFVAWQQATRRAPPTALYELRCSRGRRRRRAQFACAGGR